MSEPRWFDAKAAKIRQNARSRTQERKVAKAAGGHVQAGSGSSWRAPEDVRTDDYLIQHKGTASGSYSLKASDWLHLERNADRAGREPMFLIEFADGTVLAVTRWQ